MVKSIRARGLEFLGTNQIFNLFQFSALEHPEQKPTQTSVERGNEWNKTHLEHTITHQRTKESSSITLNQDPDHGVCLVAATSAVWRKREVVWVAGRRWSKWENNNNRIEGKWITVWNRKMHMVSVGSKNNGIDTKITPKAGHTTHSHTQVGQLIQMAFF